MKQVKSTASSVFALALALMWLAPLVWLVSGAGAPDVAKVAGREVELVGLATANRARTVAVEKQPIPIPGTDAGTLAAKSDQAGSDSPSDPRVSPGCCRVMRWRR